MVKKKNNSLFILITIFVVLIGAFFLLKVLSEKSQSETRVIFNLENDPQLGAANAPIEIVTFTDLKCPACKAWDEEILPQLQEDYINTEKVKYAFKNLPFLFKDSMTAALAGEAIYQQDEEAFWDYIELIFEHQQETKEEWATHDFILSLAEEHLNTLDLELLSKDILNETYKDEVEQDRQAGFTAKVSGTPTIFVNGIKIEDTFNYESIKKIIDKELVEQ